MCGRFTLTVEPGAIADLFDLDKLPPVKACYNIAPTQQVPVCRQRDGQREVAELKWGLVPFWADDPKIGNRMINARAETAAGKPAYRAAFAKRRCLIPSDGFFEWRKEDGGTQPYHIRRADRGPFAFAGLWEYWSPDGSDDALTTFTILTRDANAFVEPLHKRMPVVLAPADFDFWLDPQNDDTKALTDLVLTDSTETPNETNWEWVAVNRRVNSPTNDDPGCIEPV